MLDQLVNDSTGNKSNMTPRAGPLPALKDTLVKLTEVCFLHTYTNTCNKSGMTPRAGPKDTLVKLTEVCSMHTYTHTCTTMA
jgi:hypothetical protein